MAISGIADLVELLCLYKFDDFQKILIFLKVFLIAIFHEY